MFLCHFLREKVLDTAFAIIPYRRRFVYSDKHSPARVARDPPLLETVSVGKPASLELHDLKGPKYLESLSRCSLPKVAFGTFAKFHREK